MSVPWSSLPNRLHYTLYTNTSEYDGPTYYVSVPRSKTYTKISGYHACPSMSTYSTPEVLQRKAGVTLKQGTLENLNEILSKTLKRLQHQPFDAKPGCCGWVSHLPEGRVVRCTACVQQDTTFHGGLVPYETFDIATLGVWCRYMARTIVAYFWDTYFLEDPRLRRPKPHSVTHL